MINLLEEFYKTDLHIDKFQDRKVFLEVPTYKDDSSGKTSGIISAKSYQINGISQSGKTKLVKSYLLSLKKSSYLYIDCNDIRINIDSLNKELAQYCINNTILTLVLDNYVDSIEFINVTQLIITCESGLDTNALESIQLYPLDYEEFLAYEHKYDSSALNHFFQLGGFPYIHKVDASTRNMYIQKMLQYTLDSMEFDILVLCTKMMSQKVSAFTLYERLKANRKVSKDKLYKSYENLIHKNYIHTLEKFEHTRATKKIYLCDISLKSALSVDKHFGRLFENMVYLELIKSGVMCYYDEGIDFYIPVTNEVLLCMPFTDERALFKKLETIEAFLFTHGIQKITAITMNTEGSISHPLSKVEMLPFDIWAIGD